MDKRTRHGVSKPTPTFWEWVGGWKLALPGEEKCLPRVAGQFSWHRARSLEGDSSEIPIYRIKTLIRAVQGKRW